MENWSFVETASYFCPKKEHEGKYVCVVVDYEDNHQLTAYVKEIPIYLMDEKFIFEDNHNNFCKERLDNRK